MLISMILPSRIIKQAFVSQSSLHPWTISRVGWSGFQELFFTLAKSPMTNSCPFCGLFLQKKKSWLKTDIFFRCVDIFERAHRVYKWKAVFSADAWISSSLACVKTDSFLSITYIPPWSSMRNIRFVINKEPKKYTVNKRFEAEAEFAANWNRICNLKIIIVFTKIKHTQFFLSLYVTVIGKHNILFSQICNRE